MEGTRIYASGRFCAGAIVSRVFFFSSRRRHTRSLCDWSSDVCSSDLSAGGSYTVTLTVTDNQGAQNSVTHPVAPSQPNQAPTAAFTASCSALTCSFTDQSSDPDGTIATWRWDFGDGSAAGTTRNPSHTYSAGGSYTVTLRVTDNQGAPNTVTHSVAPSQPNQAPTAAFTASCPTLTCSFTDQSSDPDGTIATWRWDFGDGSAAGTTRNPSHTYSAGGSYTVTLRVTDNQGAPNTVTHSVAPSQPNQAPTAAFTASCPTLTCSFTDQSSDPDGTIATWHWDFGDGSAAVTTRNPSHTYSTGGSYTVTLTVQDNQGAQNTVTHPVAPSQPNQAPTAAFTASCPTLTCSFTDQSSDPDGTIATWHWDFGDGSAAVTTRNPSHTYSTGGSYTVTLTVQDNQGAQNTVTHPVAPSQPNQAPTAAFTASCPTLTCSFTDQSSDPDGTIATWHWDFGDGSAAVTTRNPSHTYSTGGSYTVTLTVQDNQGAQNTVTHPVAPSQPNQAPTAAFTASCPTLTCSFTDQSSDPDGTIATWHWDFGDGSAAVTTRNPSHTYSTGGSYTVTLTVQDNQGAQNTVTHPVAPSQPNQAPTAAFTASCPTLTCSFTDQSSDPDGTIATWHWAFGDGSAAVTTRH